MYIICYVLIIILGFNKEFDNLLFLKVKKLVYFMKRYLLNFIDKLFFSFVLFLNVILGIWWVCVCGFLFKFIWGICYIYKSVLFFCFWCLCYNNVDFCLVVNCMMNYLIWLWYWEFGWFWYCEFWVYGVEVGVWC